MTAGVVDQDADGITVRGAKMLATAGIMANEMLVTCIQPLGTGDERYALSFVVPMNATGLKSFPANLTRTARPRLRQPARQPLRRE